MFYQQLNGLNGVAAMVGPSANIHDGIFLHLF